jgi:hypothetical protein
MTQQIKTFWKNLDWWIKFYAAIFSTIFLLYGFIVRPCVNAEIQKIKQNDLIDKRFELIQKDFSNMKDTINDIKILVDKLYYQR